MSEFTGMITIGLGITAALAGLYFLTTAANQTPDMVVPGQSIGRPKAPWPMQMDDPNIANAYNRAAYRDNTLRLYELYATEGQNFTNDYLSTFAPTVKETQIPVQQL